MLLPYVAPIVAVTFAWTTMLNPQFGVVNYWGTQLLGWDEPIAFLSQRSSEVSVFGLTFGVPTALLTVIAFEAWRSFPFAFLFLTARLQAVPATLEEAARVDGATLTQRFRHVLLPQLMPTIAVLAVLRFIWTFNSFDDIYLLTGGGAGTEVDQRLGVQLPHRPRRHRRRGGAGPRARRDPRRAGRPLPVAVRATRGAS